MGRIAAHLAGYLAKYRRLRPRHRVAAWAVPAAVVVLVIVAMALRSPLPEFDEQGRLLQRGSVAEVHGPGVYEVSYPRSYATPPELSWLSRPMGYRMLEERADGFRFEVTLRGPHDLAPRWEARGIVTEQ